MNIRCKSAFAPRAVIELGTCFQGDWVLPIIIECQRPRGEWVGEGQQHAWGCLLFIIQGKFNCGIPRAVSYASLVVSNYIHELHRSAKGQISGIQHLWPCNPPDINVVHQDPWSAHCIPLLSLSFWCQLDPKAATSYAFCLGAGGIRLDNSCIGSICRGLTLKSLVSYEVLQSSLLLGGWTQTLCTISCLCTDCFCLWPFFYRLLELQT